MIVPPVQDKFFSASRTKAQPEDDETLVIAQNGSMASIPTTESMDRRIFRWRSEQILI